jgi:hypothetical protein
MALKIGNILNQNLKNPDINKAKFLAFGGGGRRHNKTNGVFSCASDFFFQ